MVAYTQNELASATEISKQFGEYISKVKNGLVEKIGVLKNNRLEAVVLSTAEYARLKEIEENAMNQKWTYWKEEELENFGKISIGLSKHD